MRTLNADQLKAVLSMESSLGHIHTLADVENTIDYLAKEEPEAVAGVEKFNIFDTMWSRKIQAAFPQSFVNMQNELVFSLRTDSGFSLKDVTNETQLKAKILEWLTRTAIKAVSPKERKLHFEGINKLLGTNFTLEEMTDIYTYLGNGINHDLCVKFVESGYDMSGCDADMLDGKHADAFAADKHSHSASDITSGNLPIERGGTGAGTSADACRALGAMRNTGGTFTGTVYFANGTAHYVSSAGDAHFRSVTASEDIHAKRVFEAVYNDYAELMPRGEDTEPGDIIALDTNSRQEKYVKATNLSSRIAGIHSDEYGMLIGGERVNDGEDFLKKNLPRFIPVSLAGRVHTKVIGPVNTGDCIVLSHIPGVGRAAKPCEYVDPCKVVGYAVEGDNLTEQRRLKVRVRGA